MPDTVQVNSTTRSFRAISPADWETYTEAVGEILGICDGRSSMHRISDLCENWRVPIDTPPESLEELEEIVDAGLRRRTATAIREARSRPRIRAEAVAEYNSPQMTAERELAQLLEVRNSRRMEAMRALRNLRQARRHATTPNCANVREWRSSKEYWDRLTAEAEADVRIRRAEMIAQGLLQPA